MNTSDRFMDIPSPRERLSAVTRQPQEHFLREGHPIWLVIGSVVAGYRAADLMTLVSSAIRNDLDVAPYLKDVLDRLLAGESDFHSMRPDIWKQSHPEAVRVYRQEERRDRADAKRTRRDRRRQAAIAVK
jgi:hypothetical protein